MASDEIAYRRESATREDSLFNLKLLGTLGIIGAPMLLLESLYRMTAHLPDNQNNRLVGLLGTIYIAGWIASALGMRSLRVTGKGPASKAVFIIQIAGLILAGLWAAQEIFRIGSVDDSLFYVIVDMSWPLSHLFMLVVSFMVFKAGVWRGWRRFPPLLCGLALPLFFAASAAGMRGLGLIIFPSLVMIGFALLGYAVRTEGRREGV